jgi:hypothetical protein
MLGVGCWVLGGDVSVYVMCSWGMAVCISVSGGQVTFKKCRPYFTLLPFMVKELATFDPLPVFPCNGSVTVTSYCYFKCKEIVSSYNKNDSLHSGTSTALHLSH